MRCRLVRDGAGLTALAPGWEALWRRVPDASPFLAPAWLLAWWSVFGTDAMRVAVLEQSGAILGLLPLYELGDKMLPLGVGISDRFDALLAPELPPDAAACLMRTVLADSTVAICDLPELPADAHLLAAAPPEGWRREVWAGPPCPVLLLSPSPEIPAGMRRDIRQARHRADRLGGYTRRRASAATLAEDFECLARLHGQRWAARGEAGVLADAAVRRFHSLAMPELLRAGLLRLEIVSLQDRAAAAVYALLGPGAIHLYLSGFDAAASYASPGTLLLADMLADAAAESRREAHFLRGGEAYKYAWGAQDRHNTGLRLCRAG